MVCNLSVSIGVNLVVIFINIAVPCSSNHIGALGQILTVGSMELDFALVVMEHSELSVITKPHAHCHEIVAVRLAVAEPLRNTVGEGSLSEAFKSQSRESRQFSLFECRKSTPWQHSEKHSKSCIYSENYN